MQTPTPANNTPINTPQVPQPRNGSIAKPLRGTDLWYTTYPQSRKKESEEIQFIACQHGEKGGSIGRNIYSHYADGQKKTKEEIETEVFQFHFTQSTLNELDRQLSQIQNRPATDDQKCTLRNLHLATALSFRMKYRILSAAEVKTLIPTPKK